MLTSPPLSLVWVEACFLQCSIPHPIPSQASSWQLLCVVWTSPLNWLSWLLICSRTMNKLANLCGSVWVCVLPLCLQYLRVHMWSWQWGHTPLYSFEGFSVYKVTMADSFKGCFILAGHTQVVVTPLPLTPHVHVYNNNKPSFAVTLETGHSLVIKLKEVLSFQGVVFFIDVLGLCMVSMIWT